VCARVSDYSTVANVRTCDGVMELTYRVNRRYWPVTAQYFVRLKYI